MARLISPSGAIVEVAAEKGPELLRRGFTEESTPSAASEQPVKKAAPKKRTRKNS